MSDYVTASVSSPAQPLASTSASATREKSTDPLQRLAAPLARLYDSFDEWRQSLGLYSPGTSENLTREVKTTLPANFFYDGARADITKGLSLNPAYQVTHSLTMGGMQAGGPMGPMQNPGNYNFGALYANNDVFAQGSVDHDGSLMGRLNYAWAKGMTAKAQVQLAPNSAAQSMVQLENDWIGKDFSVSVKALNPSLADGQGIYVWSYLQSVNRHLALGLENVWQRPDPSIEDSVTAALLKYEGGTAEKPWKATAQLQPAQGVLQSTYWRRLGERVEGAAELVLSLGNRKGQATLGAKYDFRTATFRASLDSSGKVMALLEQRFTPAFSFTVGGEIDHWKNTSRWGVGVSLESTSPEVETLASTGQQAPPSPPM